MAKDATKLSVDEQAELLVGVFGNKAFNVAEKLFHEVTYIDACTNDGCDKAFQRIEYWYDVKSKILHLLDDKSKI